MTYTADRLWSEVVYVAYHLHWPPGSILDLEHRARRRVLDELADLRHP